MYKDATIFLERKFNLLENHFLSIEKSIQDKNILKEIEKQKIIKELIITNNNFSKAARNLDISYTTFNRRLKEYKLF